MDGIRLDRNAIDIKGADKAIGAGLAGVAGMAAAFMAGSPIAGVSALGSFYRAWGEIDPKDKPERLAFMLIAGALVRTLEATLAESKLVFAPLESEFSKLQTRMMERLQKGDVVVTAELFEQPQSFDYLNGFVGDVLVTVGHLIDKDDHVNIGLRIRRNFTRSLDRTWSLKTEAFQSLQLALKTPFADARKLEIEQQRYLNHIQTQFSDEKLIGQTDDDPVLLSEVFVPLRAYWERPLSEKETEERANLGTGFRQKKSERMLLDFSTELLGWINKQSSKSGANTDVIRIVSGGPGIGKSSSLKAVAAELARSGKCFPIFVPLQRIAGIGDPIERIGAELRTVDACKLSENPLGEKLDQYCGEGPVVLFLDGLDEIVAAGSDGASLTRDFVRDVKSMISNKNTRQDKVRVVAIISGRIPAAEKAIGQLGLKERQILHLLPFVIEEEERGDFAKPMLTAEIEKDQRQEWWGKWQARRLGDPEEVPPLLVSEQFHDVSIEPLLFYFLVLVRAWEPIDGGEEISRNTVYSRVLQEFHKREKAKDAKGMADEFKDYVAEFEIILQAMAMAAWRGGTSRVGQVKDVELFLGNWNKPLLERFLQALGKGEKSFGASLFFHARMSEGHETFEFMHKSFTEYLVARRFRASLKRLIIRYQSRQDFGITETLLLKDWVWTWGSRNIDSDVLGFIRGEFGRPQTQAHIETVADLLRSGIGNGYPAHDIAGEVGTFDNPPKTFATMSEWARNAEEALLVGINVSLQGATNGSPTIALWTDDQMKRGPADMLERLFLQTDQGFIGKKCLAGLNLRGAHLVWAFLHTANLAEADLRGANLLGANLVGANLVGANLTAAIFNVAYLNGANLEGAMLNDADLSETKLNAESLRGANMSGSHLSNADLRESSLLAEAVGLRQVRGLDEALLPVGWSVSWNEEDEAWDITTPEGPYIDPRERERAS